MFLAMLETKNTNKAFFFFFKSTKDRMTHVKKFVALKRHKDTEKY